MFIVEYESIADIIELWIFRWVDDDQSDCRIKDNQSERWIWWLQLKFLYILIYI